MLRVGLTGGIACGKSHVLRRLAARGLATLDLDRVAHELMAPGGAVHAEVVSAFGPGILAPDGAVDRRALGARVFSDPEARARLDTLVHPRVRAEEAARVRALAAEGRPVLVSDAALLVEAGVHLRFDRLVVVHCAPEEQVRRLVARDGLAAEAARARVLAQMPIDEKRGYGHDVIETSGTVAETEAAADGLAEGLMALAARPRLRLDLPEDSALGALVHGAGDGPRGLDAAGFLDEVLEGGGLEMARLARRLRPPGEGPWYHAARPGEGAPWPEALAAPLACWSAVLGCDADWLAAAAASLARLTHGDGASVAGASLAALVTAHIARTGGLKGLDERWTAWGALARRWGGADPAERVGRAVAAAAGHPTDPIAARRQATAVAAEPSLAGALVGLVAGSSGAAAPMALRRLLGRLLTAPAR
jgi:dephospho-CoA kinase